MQGVIPIIFTKEDIPSLAFDFDINNKIFIPFSQLNTNQSGVETPDRSNFKKVKQYGGCSLVVKRTVVVRVTGVRFSPSAFYPHC
jgi:hypothetical protein